MDSFIRNRLKFIIILGVLLVGLALAIFLLTPPYKGYSVHKTPYLSSNFATIQGGSIYGYNGLSFYKSAIDNPSKITTLSSGFHLPVPKTVYWAGDDGAVLTFADQGVSGSLLEVQMGALGREVDEQTLEYVWYFNFSDHTLTLVDEFGFASPAFYYSPAKHGFYYIKYGKPVSESHGFENAALSFYSTKSLTSQSVSEVVGNEEATTYIGPCKDTETVCMIKDLNGMYSLYSVENGKQNKIGKTYDHIVATASPMLFVGSLHETPKSSENAEDELLKTNYYVIDPSTGKQTIVSSGRIANNSFVANTSGDGFFYVFETTAQDPDDDISLLSGAKNIFNTLKTKLVRFTNDTKQAGVSTSLAIIGPVSSNDAGFMLFQDVDATYLIAPQGYDYESPRPSPQKTESLLKECFEKYTKYHDFTEELGQFKVGVAYDDNYHKNIEAFSGCVATSSPQSQIGYDFIFVGLNPIDGRFVTN